MAFRLVARRHDETFTSERASVYITLANARVWASEGWDVTITDEDGSQFGPAEFEAHIVESHPVLAQAIIAPLAPEHAGEPEPQGEAVDELDQSGQRAGDDRARAGDGPVAVIEAGKPDGSSDATAASERTDA